MIQVCAAQACLFVSIPASGNTAIHGYPVRITVILSWGLFVHITRTYGVYESRKVLQPVFQRSFQTLYSGASRGALNA